MKTIIFEKNGKFLKSVHIAGDASIEPSGDIYVVRLSNKNGYQIPYAHAEPLALFLADSRASTNTYTIKTND